MAIHKLQLDDFLISDYELIAVKSSLEDYRLAYFINRNLSILLEKSPADIGVQTIDGESYFSRFVFEDQENEITWNLIKNKNRITTAKDNFSLFSGTDFDNMKDIHLLPEFKTVDYIIKIENIDAFFALEDLVLSLNKIAQISTAYSIDKSKIKSKNNLIF